MEDKGMFPKRYKLKVVLIDTEEVIKKVKTVNPDYMYSEINKMKKLYSKDEIRFDIVVSKVVKINKPRYKYFTNVPEDVAFWGVNSDNQYYAANKDYSKVVRLKEAKL